MRATATAPRPAPRIAFLAIVLGGLVLAADASARIPPPPPPPAPITLVVTGPAAIRVRLTAGVGMPCDASMNQKIFDAKAKPGFASTWLVSSTCFCVEHTTVAFPDVEWVPPRIECRPMVLVGGWWMRSNDPVVITVDGDGA